mmetsp:Transcript_36331/g.100115  ORF Transcript_36331/g.100115 Transcript_36331/m.100115 type:complete len:305 (+) Transcript_36331:209-1123(+)
MARSRHSARVFFAFLPDSALNVNLGVLRLRVRVDGRGGGSLPEAARQSKTKGLHARLQATVALQEDDPAEHEHDHVRQVAEAEPHASHGPSVRVARLLGVASNPVPADPGPAERGEEKEEVDAKSDVVQENRAEGVGDQHCDTSLRNLSAGLRLLGLLFVDEVDEALPDLALDIHREADVHERPGDRAQEEQLHGLVARQIVGLRRRRRLSHDWLCRISRQVEAAITEFLRSESLDRANDCPRAKEEGDEDVAAEWSVEDVGQARAHSAAARADAVASFREERTNQHRQQQDELDAFANVDHGS